MFSPGPDGLLDAMILEPRSNDSDQKTRPNQRFLQHENQLGRFDHGGSWTYDFKVALEGGYGAFLG